MDPSLVRIGFLTFRTKRVLSIQLSRIGLRGHICHINQVWPMYQEKTKLHCFLFISFNNPWKSSNWSSLSNTQSLIHICKIAFSVVGNKSCSFFFFLLILALPPLLSQYICVDFKNVCFQRPIKILYIKQSS